METMGPFNSQKMPKSFNLGCKKCKINNIEINKGNIGTCTPSLSNWRDTDGFAQSGNKNLTICS